MPTNQFFRRLKKKAYEADFGWEIVAGTSLDGVVLDGDGSVDTREAGFSINLGRNEDKNYDIKNGLNLNYLLTQSRSTTSLPNPVTPSKSESTSLRPFKTRQKNDWWISSKCKQEVWK